ncbi:hypothetical protein L107_08976 [Cyanobium sp. Copco_Reservoir_LC18]|nr:hypothetical protein L107_08976 [Cyanobium sp. Copco_Reservoir_LC18]
MGQEAGPGAVFGFFGIAGLPQGAAQEALPVTGRDQHDAAAAVAVQQSDLDVHGGGGHRWSF